MAAGGIMPTMAKPRRGTAATPARKVQIVRLGNRDIASMIAIRSVSTMTKLRIGVKITPTRKAQIIAN